MGPITPDGAVAGRVWQLLYEPAGGFDEFTVVLYRSERLRLHLHPRRA